MTEGSIMDRDHYAVQTFGNGRWFIRRFVRLIAARRFATTEMIRLRMGIDVTRVYRDESGAWSTERMKAPEDRKVS